MLLLQLLLDDGGAEGARSAHVRGVVCEFEHFVVTVAPSDVHRRLCDGEVALPDRIGGNLRALVRRTDTTRFGSRVDLISDIIVDDGVLVGLPLVRVLPGALRHDRRLLVLHDRWRGAVDEQFSLWSSGFLALQIEG